MRFVRYSRVMRDPNEQHQKWLPPNCPNRKCRFHTDLTSAWPFKKSGFYSRLCSPHRVQRFTCRHCHRHFSRQTFSTTYWQKRPDLDGLIFMKTVGGMANRQIARDLGVSPQTIDARLARLGRHCLLFHGRAMRGASPVRELAIDGFESFELRQYYPFHHHVAVEKGTDFFVYFSDSELRRKGRMRPEQKRRRQELEQAYGRPDPGAVKLDMTEVVRVSLRGVSDATIYSDDHRAYPRAVSQVGVSVRHRVTSGRAHRDCNNPLWEVNLLDLLIRHSGANHKRETIAWSKRRQASAER